MKISLVTVAYNSEATIADTLASIDEQSHADKEHVIVDGASSDRTLQIVAAYRRPWRRVFSERDAGIYDAMNKGIRLASGDVVGFLNSDDFYASPDVLQRVAEAFTDPAIEIVYGNLCYVAKDDVRRITRYWQSAPFHPGLFVRGWAPPHPTFFARRSLFSRFGGFDLAFPVAADMELMARFLEVHRVRSRHLPTVLVHMRSGGASGQGPMAVLSQNREIWRALKKNGLRAGLLRLALAKVVAKGRQLIARPS